jgi:hypothetical protein
MSENPDAPFKKPVFGGTQMSERTPVQQEYSGPRDLTGVLGDAPPGAWVALSRDETRTSRHRGFDEGGSTPSAAEGRMQPCFN